MSNRPKVKKTIKKEPVEKPVAIELTPSQMAFIANILQTYPFQGNTRDLKYTIIEVDTILKIMEEGGTDGNTE